MNDLPCQQFVCNFNGRHLCLPNELNENNHWILQYGKYFILADDIKAANQHFEKHFADQNFWPKGFHEVVSFTVTGCPDTPRYVGYDRFTWDVRTVEGKSKVLCEVNKIKQQIEDYLEKFV